MEKQDSMARELDDQELLAARQGDQASASLPNGHAPIPQTSTRRLEAAAHDRALDVDSLIHPKDEAAAALSTEKTILYLAYGSNLSSETFRKTRGIVPISQVNVLVPGLTLTFDLPGLPYLEPCFAGTHYRNRKTGLAQPRTPSNNLSEVSEKATLLNGQAELQKKDFAIWPKPLVGVVYEVTLSDYAHIIATEGGGDSYVDEVVPCFPFPAVYDPSSPVPDEPDTTPFMAHTLLSPRESKSPSSHRNRDPYYAQPSPRYKNLLVTGAGEHDLPAEYRQYLAALPAYRVTTRRQKVGRALFCVMWLPWLVLLMGLGRLLADGEGKAPSWLSWLRKGLFEGIWWSYDSAFKKIFGEGEKGPD